MPAMVYLLMNILTIAAARMLHLWLKGFVTPWKLTVEVVYRTGDEKTQFLKEHDGR